MSAERSTKQGQIKTVDYILKDLECRPFFRCLHSSSLKVAVNFMNGNHEQVKVARASTIHRWGLTIG